MRKLTYNATTGALLSDDQGQPNLIQVPPPPPP